MCDLLFGVGCLLFIGDLSSLTGNQGIQVGDESMTRGRHEHSEHQHIVSVGQDVKFCLLNEQIKDVGCIDKLHGDV